MLLELVRDLALDEIAVSEVNRFLPYERRLRSADTAVRCRPSEQEEIISDEIVERWCDRGGREIFPQELVTVDAAGVATVVASGGRHFQCFRRKFRRVEKLSFRPAADVPPLWSTLVLPRLDGIDAPIFDGSRIFTPQKRLRWWRSRDASIRELLPLN